MKYQFAILSYSILFGGGNVVVSQLTDPPSSCSACPPKSNCVAQEPNAPGARDKPGFGWMKCECKDGYEGDGWRCLPVNECLAGVCPDNAFCVDRDPLATVNPKYKCECNAGFVALSNNDQGATRCGLPGDTLEPTSAPTKEPTEDTGGKTPQDGTPVAPTPAPTAIIPGNCNNLCPPAKSDCIPVDDNYAPKFEYNGQNVSCRCKPGFTGDGWRCTAVDECLLPSTCNFQGGTCVDKDPSNGGYECGCENGYEVASMDDNGATSCILITPAPTVSHAPSVSQQPTISVAPTTRAPTNPPTASPTRDTNFPTISKKPSSVPSVSTKPSIDISTGLPTITGAPSKTPEPSVSDAPSVTPLPSNVPSLSQIPSETSFPSSSPSLSQRPSLTILPSSGPSNPN